APGAAGRFSSAAPASATVLFPFMARRDNIPPKSLDTPYVIGDTIPAPEAIERDGESAWALFSEISRQHDARFLDTAPASRPMNLTSEAPGWAKTRPLERGSQDVAPGRRGEGPPLFSLDAAMLVARRNNRVCPRPEKWVQFTELLPARKTLRGTQPPPAPI